MDGIKTKVVKSKYPDSFSSRVDHAVKQMENDHYITRIHYRPIVDKDGILFTALIEGRKE